jgi:hypothetical protein
MEPTTILAAVTALSKGFKLVQAAYKVGEKWSLDHDELEKLESLVGASQDFAGLFAGGGVAPPARLIAIHTAIATRAFSIALRDHWAGSASMAPGFEKRSWGQRFRLSEKEEERATDIDTRLARAVDRIARLGEGGAPKAFEAITGIVDDPIASPCYGALWEAFTNPQLDDGKQARLIELEDPGARLEFERRYRLAYAESLSSSSDLARGIFELKAERPRLLRELVVRRVSTWKGRHVFGNADTPGVPTMPLGDIYVEPDGKRQEERDGQLIETTKPLRTLVRELMAEHKIVVVRGDFGQGKSLTARTLACEWAVEYITDKETRSTDLWYPLFVKCGEDFPNHEPALKRFVARALQRHAREIGIDLAEDDDAVVGPSGATHTVYLIDGLDEVALTQGEVESFFRDLGTSIGGNGRAIVFSRKGMIPSPEKRRGIPVVDVMHLRVEGDQPGGQVADWLARWNRLSGRSPISLEQIEKRNLLEIARTPILLFMAAITWSDERADGDEVTRAEIYERFFRQIAAGKCQQDQDGHKPVADASQKLLERLVEKGELDKPLPGVPQNESQAMAMLWVLARIGWESRRCMERNESLTLLEVSTILKSEIGIGEASVLETIKVGVLLVLQADQQGGNDQILFGHKSFREFLVARYWADRLKKIVALRHDKRGALEKQLLGARLLEDDDESFVFLMQIVNGSEWNDALRERLVEWAGDCFNSEAPDFADPDAPSWLNDRRPVLREAALAIGSSAKGSAGIQAAGVMTLRSMLGWFQTKDTDPSVRAATLKSPRARLGRVHLVRANLEGANLEGANLEGANLKGANLEGANLVQANLVQANLAGANLAGANLAGANLAGANLAGANLFRANLFRANLFRANLFRANLEGAYLEGAYLKATRFDAYTLWPEDFDPFAAGAVRTDTGNHQSSPSAEDG